MGRRSVSLCLVALATVVVVSLAWRVGVGEDPGRLSLDLVPPRVFAAESLGSDGAPDRSSSPLSLATSPAASLDFVAVPGSSPVPSRGNAAAPQRVAVAPRGTFEQAELHDSSDGSEVSSGLLRVRTVTGHGGDGEASPLAGVRVAVYVPGEARVTVPVDDHQGDLERSPRSDRDGVVELVLPAGVDLRLVSTGDEPGARPRSVEVEALVEGETRELELFVETVAGRSIELSFVDASTEEPIAGVELRRAPAAARLEPAQSWGSSGTLAARTDETGAAVLSRFEVAGAQLRIVAPGYGPATFAPDSLPDVATLRLKRLAQLDVLVSIDRPEDADAVVRLSTPEAALSLTGETRLGDPDVEWRMHLDSGGQARFPYLPAGAPLTLEVELRDELRHRATAPVVLVPGAHVEHRVELGAGVLLHGSLRDEVGRPLAGSEIWLVAASERGPAYLDDPDAARRVAGRSITDSAGEFRLAAVPAGEWWVGPAPPLERGDTGAPAPFARWIRVPADGGSFRLDLSAETGHFLEGLVRGGAGGAADVTVEARLVGTGARTSARSDARGRFRIGPVTPGTYEVAARPSEKARHSGSRACLVRPGDPIELELLPGRVLVVHGLDAEGAPADLGQVRWTRSDVGPFVVGEHRARTGASSVVVSGLEAGTYDVFATAFDGRVGTVPAVQVEGSRPRRDVRVPLVAPARITLTSGATEPLDYEVFLGRCSIDVGELAPGNDALLLAPPGELTLRYKIGTRKPAEERLTLAPGANEDIVLRDPVE